MKKITFLLIFPFLSLAQKPILITSPNKQIEFELKVLPENLTFSIKHKNLRIVEESPLGLRFDSGNFQENLQLGKVVFSTKKEEYDLIVGKNRHVNEVFNEAIVPLTEKTPPYRHINLTIRIFNDGLGFRYEVPLQKNWTSYRILEENTAFQIAPNAIAHSLQFDNYTTSHEGFYVTQNFSAIPENKLLDLPATFEIANKTYLAITEAAVRDFAGLYLQRDKNKLVSKLSPLPNQASVKVIANLPHKTPWRVLLISDNIGDLIKSNLLTNLNEPCKLKETDWIKPGKTTFTWWNGNIIKDLDFQPGNNFQTNKFYIDFASENNLQFHSIYGYSLQPWYLDDGMNFGTPGPHTDVTKSVASLNMPEICEYAKSKNVGIHLWVNWKALYPQLEEAFALYEKWGIKGLMVDFMDRDDQEMINIQEEILQKAGNHHLFIQFHGCSKPSGLSRTYPNEFTREATLNYESYKWGHSINANHDITMPFTRLLAGPTDYHLGGFRSLPTAEHKIQFTNPFVTSTRVHMLAMYVVLESYLGMVCDTPMAYEGQEGFDWIQKIPTTWDETKVPFAKINEYVCIARRKNEDWFMGTITNQDERKLEIKLDFLSDGNYIAHQYSDAKDSNIQANHLVKLETKVTKNSVISLELAQDGGNVVFFEKEK